tara:strand:+ start:459 stop:1025 length:567 start_codon:yes stop_codon:yes gene_type:complete
MSLAMYAAPFENENNNNNENKKNNSHNKTIKNIPKQRNTTQKASSGKVSLLLKEIHDKDGEEDFENNLADFDPIPKPESVGVNRTIARETNPDIDDDNVEFTENSEIPSQYAKQYYNQYTPQNYNNYHSVNNEENKLMNKINYMIQLLEEQKDQKTNHVTEEVVLYSFLGVFVIFVVDSFARVGKYVR